MCFYMCFVCVCLCACVHVCVSLCVFSWESFLNLDTCIIFTVFPRIVVHALIYGHSPIFPDEKYASYIDSLELFRTMLYNSANFFKVKKCTLDSLLVHAPLPQFHTQVHAPQCRGYGMCENSYFPLNILVLFILVVIIS